jgi:hypothetical protein
MALKLDNLKNISKAVAKQFIIINVFFIFLIQSCTKIIPISDLVFKDCIIYSNNQPFTGKYNLNKENRYILTKVLRGRIINEKTFINDLLLIEKKYDSCGSGYQIVYGLKGQILSEGQFKNEKRVGSWKYFKNDSIYFVEF